MAVMASQGRVAQKRAARKTVLYYPCYFFTTILRPAGSASHDGHSRIGSVDSMYLSRSAALRKRGQHSGWLSPQKGL
jgi:hypothetical protein